jgi:hypothetical protein
MSKGFSLLIAGLILTTGILAGCTLPGAASPTPFTFPTPNLTHTAIFESVSTPTPAPPTQPVPPPNTPVATLPTIVTPAASATTGALSSRPNGSPITAAYLTTAPTIDGNLADWTTTPYAVNQVVFGTANWVGSNDASATFYIGWDTGNLYLGAHIVDERFVQNSTGRYLYLGDDVEVQLDTNLASDYYLTVLDGDDYQLGLSAGNFGILPPEAYLWYPAALEGARATVTVKAVAAADGYTLEARIPWTVFSVTPSGGSRFGFALSCSDNDLPATSRQQSMVSTVNTRMLTNPTTWGTLILEQPGGGS